MKSIYVYINNQDVVNLVKHVNQLGIFIYNENSCEICVIPSISDIFINLIIGYNYNDGIEYNPCFFTSEYIQPARISMADNNNANAKRTFMSVKKYIKEFYILSSDKSTYIGPCMYQDWIERKYKFPMLLEYLEFDVDENKLYDVINCFHDNGYIVRNNKTRIKDINQIDIMADSFVVFKQDLSMKTKIINKSIILYEYDSECIWIYRKPKRKKIVLQLDKRLTLNSSSTLKYLYEQVKAAIK